MHSFEEFHKSNKIPCPNFLGPNTVYINIRKTFANSWVKVLAETFAKNASFYVFPK